MMLLQIAGQNGFWTDLIDKLGSSYFRRLLIDVVAICVLIYAIYLPNNNRKREYLFTFLMFNLAIFHIAFLLNTVTFSMGAAFGLFAVFGLLRYRTEDIPMKDMTYLFLSIAFGLISAVTRGDWEPAIVCSALLVPTFVLDSGWVFRKEQHKDIRYERIELIRPEDRSALMADLRSRTGLDIHFLSVESIDFTRDTATVRVFYYERDNGWPRRKDDYASSNRPSASPAASPPWTPPGNGSRVAPPEGADDKRIPKA